MSTALVVVVGLLAFMVIAAVVVTVRGIRRRKVTPWAAGAAGAGGINDGGSCGGGSSCGGGGGSCGGGSSCGGGGCGGGGS